MAAPIPFLNVSTAILLFLGSTTLFFLCLLPSNDGNDGTTSSSSPSSPSSLTTPALSLLIFNNLNIFIALCEICLGRYITLIQADYKKLLETYGPTQSGKQSGKQSESGGSGGSGGNGGKRGRETEAVIAFLLTPLTPSQLFDGRTWSKMWSTYALYDPSYQNQESFGFFIDFGNGLSTVGPSVLINLGMVLGGSVDAGGAGNVGGALSSILSPILSPLVIGCIGLAMYWQVMYGTIIYVLSYVFNERYKGKPLLEVCLFVGFSNSLWFFFPILGIYYCVVLLRDGELGVFYR